MTEVSNEKNYKTNTIESYPEMNKEPNQQQYKIINLINYETSKETYHKIISQIVSQISSNQLSKQNPNQLSKQNEKQNQHVGLILWYKQPETNEIEILTGIETHYLTETFDPTQEHTQKLITSIQHYEKVENCSSHKIANQVFKERSEILSQIFQIPITFETIKNTIHTHPSNLHNNYQTHFRVMKNQNKPKYGIVKGNVEEGEIPFQAMMREIQEELQIPLNGVTKKPPQLLSSKHIFRFQHSILHTYHYQINTEEYKKINQLLMVSKPQGELMEIDFRPLSKLNNNKKTNAKTTEHIKTFRNHVFKFNIII